MTDEHTIIPEKISLDYLRQFDPRPQDSGNYTENYPTAIGVTNLYDYLYSASVLKVEGKAGDGCYELMVKCPNDEHLLGEKLYRIRVSPEEYVRPDDPRFKFKSCRVGRTGLVEVALDFYTKNNIVKISVEADDVTETLFRILHTGYPGIINGNINMNFYSQEELAKWKWEGDAPTRMEI